MNFYKSLCWASKKKKIINSHRHLKHDKLITRRPIQESWILIKGKAKITYYDNNKKVLKSFIMSPGDISITFSGGHKLEIKRKIQYCMSIKLDLIKVIAKIFNILVK